MPKLQDNRKILKLSIKSIEGSEITLRDGLLAGDMDYIYGGATVSDVERALRAFCKMLISWNLTDEKDQPLPITLENVKKLNLEDIVEMLGKTSVGKGTFGAGFQQVKKN